METNQSANALSPWWEEYRKRLPAADSHRVELFVRSRTPVPGAHGRPIDLYRSLERRVEDDAIDACGVTVLGGNLCLCENCRALDWEPDTLETVEELLSWRGGGIRSSGFTERVVSSSVVDEQYSVIVPPETALGVYVDGAVVGVFPCVSGRTCYRPEAYLDGLATGMLGSDTDGEAMRSPADQ